MPEDHDDVIDLENDMHQVLVLIPKAHLGQTWIGVYRRARDKKDGALVDPRIVAVPEAKKEETARKLYLALTGREPVPGPAPAPKPKAKRVRQANLKT